MLPPLSECKRRIKMFEEQSESMPHSYELDKQRGCMDYDFDSWSYYKRKVEKGGHSLLEPYMLSKTATEIRKYLKAFGMARTGIASQEEMKRILKSIAEHYHAIRFTSLGSGQMRSIRADLAALYEGLSGITKRSDIVAKSKTLMAVWGQTPSFDKRVRHGFCTRGYGPKPYSLPHLETHRTRYTPQEFCDIVEALDRWVAAWPGDNGGASFASLIPGAPIGRIIDMVYWPE
jgi:hypothetical protein